MTSEMRILRRGREEVMKLLKKSTAGYTGR
jgi:hypothetical protein